jgi:hypothetical protein
MAIGQECNQPILRDIIKTSPPEWRIRNHGLRASLIDGRAPASLREQPYWDHHVHMQVIRL